MIADLLGIIFETNPVSSRAWLYNLSYSMCLSTNYYASGKDPKLCWLLPGQPFRICPLIDYFVFPHDFVKSKYPTFSSFVNEMLDSSYYVLVDLDSYYLRGSEYHFSHDCLINGYGDKDIFLCNDYFGSHYKTMEINAEVLNNSFDGMIKYSLNDYIGGIVCIKPVENYIHKFDTTKLRYALEDYINGELSKDYSTNEIYQFERVYSIDYKTKVVYGVNCYDAVCKYFEMCLQEQIPVAHMVPSMILQRNDLIYDGLVFLINDLGIDSLNTLLSIAANIVEEAEILLSMIIKQNTNKYLGKNSEEKTYLKFISYINNIKKYDIELTSKYIDLLKHI